MIGFEVFEISSWLDNGLTKHLISERSTLSLPVRKQAWTAAILLSLAASSGVMTFESKFDSSASQLSMSWVSTLVSEVRPTSYAAGEVPVGYWPKLMKTVKEWKPLEEVALTEFPPYI
jgi:hypothetical protein